MALLFIEGFDFWDPTSSAEASQRGWSGTFNSTVAGRFSGLAVKQLNGDSDYYLLPSTYSTLICGCAIKTGSVATDADYLILAAGGTSTCRVGFSAGKVRVKNSAGTTIATGTTTLAPNTWIYVEVKLVVGTSGTVTVQLNGVAEIASTVGNFGTSNVDRVKILAGAADSYFDDMYICDTSGAHNTGLLGDVRVETLYPTGDGAHSQWTPSSGSAHYSLVNEHPPDGDTSYVADANVGDRDSYTFGDLSSLSGSVFGLQTNLYARKDDSGARQIAAVARPGSTDRDGATVTLTASHSFYSEIRETNPDTSASWAISEVNGSEFGVKLVA